MKRKILVVDDEFQIRQSLSKLLQGEGYEVLLAADGQQAVEQVDPRSLDLVLLDLNLPARSGWDVFEHITSLNPLLPIIIITGRDQQQELATAAGVGALMEKPLNIPVLLHTIAALLAELPEVRLNRIAGVEELTRYFPSKRGLEQSPPQLKPRKGKSSKRGALSR